MVFVVHGEDQVTDTFAEANYGKVLAAAHGTVFGGCVDLLQVKSCPFGIKERKRQWKNPRSRKARMHFTEWGSQRQRGMLDVEYIRMKDMQTKN